MSGAARLLRSPSGAIGALLVGATLVAAVVGAVWTPLDPFRADPYDAWAPPGDGHALGTDAAGRDLASYLLAGATTTAIVAAAGAAIAGAFGLALGAAGALVPPRARAAVGVLIDVLIAFPVVLIAMMLAATWGGSVGVVVLAVGVGFGANVARVVRGELARLRGGDVSLMARASGAGPLRRLREHLLPGVAPVLLVQVSWTAGLAILAEAGLSYLGYGAGPDTASWGRLLSELQPYIAVQPLAVLWPGLAITVAVLGCTLLGDGLRDALDPRLARRAPTAAPLPGGGA